MRLKRTIPAVVAVAALAVPAAANASVTYDSAMGKGFVGKGDVQNAFSALKNNNAIQTVLIANPQAVTFSSSQAASQALSSTAEQSGTQRGIQTGTQSVAQSVSQPVDEHYRQDVECETTNGRNKIHREGDRSGSRLGEREGTREGSRDASRGANRSGTRTGSRTGSLVGSLKSDLNGDPRQTKGQNQFTGFDLNGFKVGPAFTASGAPVWGDASFGEWGSFGQWGSFGEWGAFGATTYGNVSYDDPTFDSQDIEWGSWVTDEGEGIGNPAVCLGGGQVTDLSNVTTLTGTNKNTPAAANRNTVAASEWTDFSTPTVLSAMPTPRA